MKEPIKDFYNVIKGWVETKPNGDKVYYNFKNFIVAKYDASRNVTLDFHNFIFFCFIPKINLSIKDAFSPACPSYVLTAFSDSDFG